MTKVSRQLEDEILETGKRTCIDLGIHGLSMELVRLIGRMKYRSSYGQNLLHKAEKIKKTFFIIASEKTKSKYYSEIDFFRNKVFQRLACHTAEMYRDRIKILLSELF